jgi:hypothetical protein
MIPTVSVKLTASWAQLTALLATAVPHVMKEVERATGVNAALVQRTVRASIRSGGYTANRPLTRFIKGSSKPLVGRDSQLWKAITSKVMDPFSAEIGVLKGTPMVNIAAMVHDGVTIKVTPKMRKMFALLADAGNSRTSMPILTGRARELWIMRPKKGWKALKGSTTHIVIPPRPFLTQAVGDPELQKAVQENWLTAVSAGIAGYTPKLRTKL